MKKFYTVDYVCSVCLFTVRVKVEKPEGLENVVSHLRQGIGSKDCWKCRTRLDLAKWASANVDMFPGPDPEVAHVRV